MSMWPFRSRDMQPWPRIRAHTSHTRQACAQPCTLYAALSAIVRRVRSCPGCFARCTWGPPCGLRSGMAGPASATCDRGTASGGGRTPCVWHACSPAPPRAVAHSSAVERTCAPCPRANFGVHLCRSLRGAMTKHHAPTRRGAAPWTAPGHRGAATSPRGSPGRRWPRRTPTS